MWNPLSIIKPLQYWTFEARRQRRARALAARIGLRFPTKFEIQNKKYRCHIIYPIRRLIITGQDTPENFATLLGSNWQDVSNVVIEKPSLGPNQQLIFDFITEMRLIILMSDTEGILPPIDSPTYKLAQALDEGRNGWTPRPSTNKEHQATGDMMEIVEAIEKVFGSDLHDQIWLTAAELSEFFRRKGIMIPNGDSMEWFVVALHVTGRDWRLESVIGPVLLRRRSE